MTATAPPWLPPALPSGWPYTIREALSRNGDSVRVYRAVRKADGCPVILKVVDPRWRRPQDLDQLKRRW